MCVIVGDVEKVANTRIVVAATALNSQLVVYANEVTLSGPPVAMVLPFYNGRSGVEVIPTEPGDVELFDVLKRACEPMALGLRSGGQTLSCNSYGRSASPLPVLRAGSYRYSVAPTPADLRRIDERIFRDLPADLSALIAEYAAGNFGFLVCLLDESAAYAPFAYISDRLPGGALFVPTRHFHTHPHHGAVRARGFLYPTVVGDSSTATAAAASGGRPAAETAVSVDWDHEVYVVGLEAAQLMCNSMGGLAPTQVGVNRVHGAYWAASALKSILSDANQDPAYIAKYRITNRFPRVDNVDMVIEAAA